MKIIVTVGLFTIFVPHTGFTVHSNRGRNRGNTRSDVSVASDIVVHRYQDFGPNFATTLIDTCLWPFLNFSVLISCHLHLFCSLLPLCQQQLKENRKYVKRLRLNLSPRRYLTLSNLSKKGRLCRREWRKECSWYCFIVMK